MIVKTYNTTSVFGQRFIMYERQPYFYREIYEVLKNFTENTFPLRQYLIDADVSIKESSLGFLQFTRISD